MNPPPVIWLIPLNKLVWIPGKSCLMYIRVGTRMDSPSVVSLFHGAASEYDRLDQAATLRTREKQLEWIPEEGRPMKTSLELNVRCRKDRVAFDGTDAETGQVIVVCARSAVIMLALVTLTRLIDSRHLCNLSTNQRPSSL
jgi:hypothetical protein